MVDICGFTSFSGSTTSISSSALNTGRIDDKGAPTADLKYPKDPVGLQV